MIAKLRGVVDTLASDRVIVDVGGVGYGVYVSSRTLKCLCLGEHVSLLVESVIRQEQAFLYGFLTEAERHIFRLILGVQGAGAKTALAVLSCWEADALIQLIQNKDAQSITRADGVGPKLAHRMILELHPKVTLSYHDTWGANVASNASAPLIKEEHHDAIEGLIQLGYSKMHAMQTLEKVMTEEKEYTAELDAATLVRLSLKRLLV